MGKDNKEKIELKLDEVVPFSENQKTEIYNRYLEPLKSKIIEFIFIDGTVATELMKEYNELLSQIDGNNVGSLDILRKINDLEARVEKEKRERPKQNSETIAIFESKCEELLEGLNQDTIEQTEYGLKNLKALLENVDNTYTLEQRNKIQSLLSNLHFHIIKEKVRKSSGNLDLREEIPEEEQNEMKIAMYYQVAKLLNSSRDRKREFGQKIKESIQLYSQTTEEMQMLYDESIWENFVQAEEKSNEMLPKNRQSNELALVPRRRGIFERLWNKLRIKTEIEKIADEVVTSEMLDKFIDHNVPQDRRYIPDKRLPVYLFLQQLEELNKQYEQSIKFAYVEINGIGYKCKINVKNHYDGGDYIYVKIKDENKQKIEVSDYVSDKYRNPISLMRFADFLGYGESFAQQVVQYYYNEPDLDECIYEQKFAAPLCKRLKNALEEYQKTKNKFFDKESEKAGKTGDKRKQFIAELRINGGIAAKIPEKTQEEIKKEKER